MDSFNELNSPDNSKIAKNETFLILSFHIDFLIGGGSAKRTLDFGSKIVSIIALEKKRFHHFDRSSFTGSWARKNSGLDSGARNFSLASQQLALMLRRWVPVF